MFHDIGLIDGHRAAHERFEIDGANAARAFLQRHGLPEDEIAVVWDAIAAYNAGNPPLQAARSPARHAGGRVRRARSPL
jgi:hypothetical protein